MLVYRSNGTGYQYSWGTSNIGQGSGAIAWRTGDVNNDGRTDIIQLWNNNGRLGIIVYRSNGSGYYYSWGTSNIGQGSGALAWLTQDVDGDGRTDIVQTWNNGGRLAINVYRSNGAGYELWLRNPDTGQGAGALAWLPGDVDNDGEGDLIHPWNNSGQLGLNTYSTQ